MSTARPTGLTYEVPETSETGDELVLRIPRSLAQRVGLEAGSPCALTVQSGKLVVATATSSAWAQLEQLLATEFTA